ncbi:canalicular multispecific organic anion transporter 1 [Podospora fimiseda]|uniref:Canalicular multispecific organic anion transporter 1 n=1 Tax=Podospora fimiseda TaxID=252190 RepID=A0AAN7GRI1_9PEZI|nr:canalicular multispecific organic anion transporter 1 [Podospora fimiseda]
MDFYGCVDDHSFGPSVHGCRDDFDFTIKFEKIFFSLIPASIFIALSLSRIVYLGRKPFIVTGRLLLGSKLATICIYGLIQLSLLVLSSTKSRKFASFFISSDAVGFASAISMILLSYLEHSRSPRPSLFLNGYFFITILLDIAQSRTLWLASTKPAEFAFTKLFTTGAVVKAVLIILESLSKARWIINWDTKAHSPEETTGLYGLGAFFWLNTLFLQGYRKILSLDDLFPLDHNMAAEKLHAKLGHHLKVSKFRGKKYGLAKALFKALAAQLLLPVGPRIALGAFQFCQPFLIETMLRYLEKPSETTSKNIGYGLIGATLLIFVGIAVSGAFYWYYQERAIYMGRGLLASAVYTKTTEAKLSADDDAAPLTLMSSDVERIITGTLKIHEFWANTIEVALASWLLSRYIGTAFIGPIVVVIFCIICSTILSRLITPRQKLWMEKIQKRVGLISSVLGQMKHLKISGLTGPVEKSVQDARIEELRVGARFRKVLVFGATVGFMPLCIAPVVTFAIASRTLDVTTIFTSMSYILLLASPLVTLFQDIPGLLVALTCFARIQAFLEKDSRVDFREERKIQGDNKPELGPSMQIKGSFGWKNDHLAIKDIELEIPDGCLTIIVGPVASGKSTLCKVLLGDVPVQKGKLLMEQWAARKIGYCDQTPYLSNATICENIVGFSPFNQEGYDEVVEATMLRPDLAVLPQGDETKVGSSGIALSGGQKQRVALARALYHETSFFVFDDILSGLDADTEEQVFRRVFGPDGLLKRRKATAVLCTHSVRHLPSANHVVALGSDGKVVEQGTFQELMTKGGYVYKLDVKETDSSSSSDVDSSSSAAQLLPKRPPPKANPIIKADDQARATGDWTVYRHYFARVDTKSIVSFFVFGALWGFCGNFATIWLKFWSEDVSSAHPKHSNAYWNGLYAMFQVGTLFSLFCLAMIVLTSMIRITGAKLHEETLSTVMNAPLSFFTTTDIGAVTNLFSQDMTLIDGQLPMSLLNLAPYIFEIIGMAAVIATVSPYLAITYPFLAAGLYGLQKFYLQTSRQVRLLDLEAKSPLYSHFIDTMKGITTYRAFGWVPDGINKNNILLDTSQRPAYLLAMIQRWLGFSLQIIIAVLAFSVVTLSTQLRSNTALTGASLVTLMSFGEALTYIIKFYTMLETSIGAVARLKTFSETVESENKPNETLIPPPEWPSHGAIEITDVSASYGSEEDDSQHLALKSLSLKIPPGSKIAICGRSGSGKSSLILLLLRLLDPTSTSDSITIDSLPLSQIPRPLLRTLIISISQDPVFLPNSSSYHTNLDPSHQSTPEEAKSVLELVNLWDFISSRGGLDSAMSGDTFSQGQKQLFSLARAILRKRIRTKLRKEQFGADNEIIHDGGILLLDEYSSSVDKDTDEQMQMIIAQEFKEYTIVMVSHRLGMVMSGFIRLWLWMKGG